MADISDIKTEMETIANAMSGINSFKYGNPMELNESRQKTKPMLMLHKQRQSRYPEFFRGHKTYEIKVGIYDTYFESQKSTKAYDLKQKDMENLMEHFLREFRLRSLGKTTEVTTPHDWQLENNVTVEIIEILGVDKLVGIEASLSLNVISDCDQGTFSY